MTGKRHNWHRAWSRLPNGRLRHISGAEFVVVSGNGFKDINAAPETLAEYQAYELARGVPLLDLAYDEDSTAEVDMNIVCAGSGEFIEVQGTAEGAPFDRGQLNELLDLGQLGCAELAILQQDALSEGKTA